MLELASSPGIANGYMWLSNASNSTIESVNVHTIGYPGLLNGATCAAGVDMYHAFDAVLNVTTHITGRGLVKTYLDSSEVQSGSQFYYCPGGSDIAVCEAGDQGYVVGVLKGPEVDGQGDVVSVWGARVPGAMHDWAVAILPSYH